jgi:hypothetical protein
VEPSYNKDIHSSAELRRALSYRQLRCCWKKRSCASCEYIA